MSRSRHLTIIGTCAGLLSLCALSHAQLSTGYLYVSDYGSQKLDRYTYQYNAITHAISNFAPYGINGNLSNAVFISSQIKEGLQGTANDIIVVNTGGNSLTRYSLSGTTIGTINVTNANGSAHTFSAIGNVVISPNGKYLYAPEESGNVIDKVDLLTGRIVANVAFTGAHDLAISKDGGTIYAAAYNNANSSSQGIYAFDSNLGHKTQLIAFNDHGLTNPSGISVAGDGSLYIQQNVHNNGAGTAGGPDGVYHYALSSSSYNATATYVSSTFSPLLHFTFGNNIGPDGNLYIAALGGASGRGGNNGYTDGVYEFNTTTLGVSQIIAGETQGTNSVGPSGLVSPKYLQFGFNFVAAGDPGAPPVPEPGNAAMLCSMMVGSAGLLLRHRRLRR